MINPENNHDIITLDALNSHIDELIQSEETPTNIQIVLQTQMALKATKSNAIIRSLPLIKHKGNSIIYPNTINVIQGQAGVHKSRFAETLCAVLLKKQGCKNELMGYEKTEFQNNYTVLYVDTERNLIEQYPLALQAILKMAGFEHNENPINFEYISLLPIKRKERFSTLKEYLKIKRNSISKPLFIVLDVSTDCIEDFNRPDVSMELIDLMNVTINEYHVVFLCLIHENPKSDKARGHFGTELINKATTVIQISCENSTGENDIFKVSCPKTRNSKKPSPFQIKYCENINGLVCLNKIEVKEVINKKLATNNHELIEIIKNSLCNLRPMKKRELKDLILKKLGVSERTNDRNIKELIDNKTDFLIDEIPYYLTKIGNNFQLLVVK